MLQIPRTIAVVLVLAGPGRAVAQAPVDPSRLTQEECEMKSYAAYKKGEYSRSLAYLDQWLKMAPESRKAHHLKGYVHLDMGRPRFAVDDFSAALKVAPGSLEDRAGRARALSCLKEFDAATRDIEVVIKAEPRHAFHRIQRAAIREADQRYDAAIDDLVEALRLGRSGEDPSMSDQERTEASIALERVRALQAKATIRPPASPH